MEYTKGEWKIDERKEGIGYFTTGNLDKTEFPYIINMPCPPFALGRAGAVVTIDPMNPKGALANAHLIAAAPEMYEALKECLALLDKQREEYNNAISLLPRNKVGEGLIAQKSRKALAKAEGKG